LAGDLDYFNIGKVRQILAPIHGNAVIDLTQAQFLDAAAMAELVRAAKRAAPDRSCLSCRRRTSVGSSISSSSTGCFVLSNTSTMPKGRTDI
jgi:anti-anti-sigma regulatory factor